jgi:hypothetical protein
MAGDIHCHRVVKPYFLASSRTTMFIMVCVSNTSSVKLLFDPWYINCLNHAIGSSDWIDCSHSLECPLVIRPYHSWFPISHLCPGSCLSWPRNAASSTGKHSLLWNLLDSGLSPCSDANSILKLHWPNCQYGNVRYINSPNCFPGTSCPLSCKRTWSVIKLLPSLLPGDHSPLALPDFSFHGMYSNLSGLPV